ncbi:MAG: hypothetical protein AB7G11_05015 [Phycisphaerales bacterium]
MSVHAKSRRYLIKALAAGEADLYALARECGLTMIEMAAWAAKPRHQETLGRLERLLERRTSLLLADARAEAAAALRRMALAESPKETARRACIDLLKLQPESASRRRGTGAPRAASDTSEADELNKLMREMGEEPPSNQSGGPTDDAGEQA